MNAATRSIKNQIVGVRSRIQQVAEAVGRDADEITLIAVSKTRSAESVMQAYAAGCRDFGESYVQEAIPKIIQLTGQDIEWHFIGPIQSNKTQAIAQYFDWVHSVDRLKIAQRLHAQRPPHLDPLAVCMQVNISAEKNKSGIDLSLISELAEQIQGLSRLQLRGLMAIARHDADSAELHQSFSMMREGLKQLNLQGMSLDTLSMGMTNDMDVAIMEGATHIRIGTGIFGPREKKP